MAEGKPNKPKITPGYRVGKLTVEEETPQRRCGYTVWRCRCDCGGEILLDTRYLQRGTIKDCGCTTKVSSRKIKFLSPAQKQRIIISVP